MAPTGSASYLTSEARRRLEEELARLRARRAELAAGLEGATGAGDRADAAEILELRDDLVWLDEQIAATVARLSGAESFGGTAALPDGTEVTLRLQDGTVTTLRVVAFPGESPEGTEDSTLTVHSPLGRALAGHRAGDTVSYATPDGKASATILDLRPPDPG